VGAVAERALEMRSGRRVRRSRFTAPRRLRATRAGWCFIAIVFGVGFAALNTGNNLLYLVLSMMLSFLVLSGLLSETALRGIRVERRLPADLFAGAANRVALRVYNQQTRVAAFAVSLDDRLDADDERASAGRAFALRIGPNEHVDRSYAFTPEHRGDVRFDVVRVSTRFPFGLFVKSLELETQSSALVYPEIRPVPVSENRATSEEHHDHSGTARRGDDVAGLREFVPGDAPSRVHWRRSLRSGRLLVGEREGEASGEIEILLRAADDLPQDAIEERIVQAASEVVAHLEAGLRVGLRSPRIRIPPGAGATHRRELLMFLARVTSAELRAKPSSPEAPPDIAVEAHARGQDR